MLGVTCDVLFEGETRETVNGHYRYCGCTPNYHKVTMELQTKYLLKNQIITCEIINVIDNRLLNVVALKELNHFSRAKDFNSIKVAQIS